MLQGLPLRLVDSRDGEKAQNCYCWPSNVDFSSYIVIPREQTPLAITTLGGELGHDREKTVIAGQQTRQ